MKVFAVLGFLAFFVASLAVGVRLILLWKRTRQWPELLIGIGVLGIGPVGFGSMMVGMALLGSSAPPLAAQCAFAFGSLSACCGVVAQSVFAWRVYHPDSRVLLAGIVAIGLALAISLGLRGLQSGFVPSALPDTSTLAQSALQVGCLLWASCEALRYWRLMKKRERIGMADPVVGNRFLLWGIAAGAAGVGSGVGTVASLVLAVPSLQIPWVVFSSSLHGLTAAVAMSLAFMPPAGYLRWVRSQGAARSVVSAL
jgi:hypothetical protein